MMSNYGYKKNQSRSYLNHLVIANDIQSVKSIRPSTYFISEMEIICTKFNTECLVPAFVVGLLVCGFMLPHYYDAVSREAQVKFFSTS